MKYLTKTVTLYTAEVVDESKLNHYQLKADCGQQPDIWFKYTVEICRQKFKTSSQNQKYPVGGHASVMVKDGKCELLYDSIFNNQAPFTLDNAAVSLWFFGGEDISDISNLNYYILKKGLLSEKRRRKALKSDPKSISSKALIIQRKSYGEWQVNAKGYVRFTLTLLLKTESGFFITTFTDWDKTERFGSILKHVFDLSVGEIVPVIYSADNPANIMIDYENLKPFSFEPIPLIPVPGNEGQDET